ncbi:hypothetical protein JG688_00014185 [Phytophthora aleatoria]|uniref:Uncharacterized protein n=1 Tax=Phytophthora aleatoria TaxID=2496075 RepID=A0A8J5ME39_9STRA|nr:hypothetical protein JG688_00014185 [Phytophthora aleatoria]
MVELILQKSIDSTDATLALETAVNDNLVHVTRMIMHRGIPFDTTRILRAAVATECLNVIDLLLPESDSASASAAVDDAVGRDRADIMVFVLMRVDSDGPDFILMKTAFQYRRGAVVKHWQRG